MNNRQLSAEECVIGCVLHGVMDGELMTGMQEGDFMQRECRALWTELARYWRQWRTVDMACVADEHLSLAVRCYELLPSVSRWRTYMAASKENACKQKAMRYAASITAGGMSLDSIQQAAAQILAATQGQEPIRRMAMGDALAAFWQEQAKPTSYLPTGIGTLDRTVMMEPGDYIVVGARPSAGKTAFALGMARAMANAGISTAFYSYETKVEKLMGRTIAAYCGIDMGKIKRRELDGLAPAEHLGEDLAELPLTFVESAGRSARWLQADVLRGNYRAVFIDYIGLMPAEGNSRFEKMTNASMAIREMCQATGCVAVVLCQINRQGKAAPSMEDLKESGQIEQDADAILLLHNEAELAERGDISPVQLIVAKNKEGQVGCIRLLFDGQKQTFYEQAR